MMTSAVCANRFCTIAAAASGLVMQPIEVMLQEGRKLVEDGMIDSKVGPSDRRQRLLTATPEGEALVRSLSDAQNARMRRVFMEAGAEAVQGFKTVLADMIDEDSRESVLALVNDQPGT